MEQISLKDFIKNALVEIAEAVVEGNKDLNSKYNSKPIFGLTYHGHSKEASGIEFDVAVTGVKSQAAGAGFKISIVEIGGGAKTEKKTESELVQRIKFVISLHDNWTGDFGDSVR